MSNKLWLLQPRTSNEQNPQTCQGHALVCTMCYTPTICGGPCSFLIPVVFPSPSPERPKRKLTQHWSKSAALSRSLPIPSDTRLSKNEQDPAKKLIDSDPAHILTYYCAKRPCFPFNNAICVYVQRYLCLYIYIHT